MPVPSSAAGVHVVLNAASGTVKDLTPKALRELIQATASASHFHTTIHMVEPGEVEDLLQDLVSRGEPEIWVGGGDGTVLTAARLVMNTDVVLGILPLGTFNLLARDLGIPLDPAAAVAALIEARVEFIDVAEVNKHPFLCAAQFGFFPAQSEEQEEFHGRHWWRKLFIGFKNIFRSYFRYPELRLLLEQSGGRPVHLKTRSLTVSNNVYAESLGLVPARDSLDDGSMGIYVSRHHSWRSVIRGLVLTMAGYQARDKDMLIFERQEFVLKSSGFQRIPATLDGEKTVLRSPLHFKVHSRGLRVRKVDSDRPAKPGLGAP